ncbi:Hypothetical predicted protein [Pelobates cultripes]|uniref:Uncharacterized protein n=1 Tax=Pelobates cultripes TaxID=61616 RepID=A0AAD1SN25_PELCU|nr:Hypothetical predicted protein [Pelobates cultripes]
MPFQFPQTGKKTRRKSGAYLTLQTARYATEAAAIDARHGTYLLKDLAEPDGYTMGRRSQKPPLTAGRGTQDIGDMLQRPMAPKMATPAEHTPASPDEGEQHGTGLEISTAPQATESLAGQDTQTPATKQDIADLLMEMRRMHAADINLIKTEMQAMTARTQATEEDILDLQREAKVGLDGSDALMHRRMGAAVSDHFNVSDQDLEVRKVEITPLEKICPSDPGQRRTISMCHAYCDGNLVLN